MGLPKGSVKAARGFAKAVIREKWDDLPPLLTAARREQYPATALAAEFGWGRLGPRLRREFIAASGEPEEMVPELDPPRRYEVFEVEDREPPAGHDPAAPGGWVEVDFQPAEDSEFDVCYNLFVAFVDEGGPRVAAFEIVSATE